MSAVARLVLARRARGARPAVRAAAHARALVRALGAGEPAALAAALAAVLLTPTATGAECWFKALVLSAALVMSGGNLVGRDLALFGFVSAG